MPFENNQRITRRRSSAGPTPPKRPIGNNSDFNGRQNQGPRPTFLTLRAVSYTHLTLPTTD